MDADESVLVTVTKHDNSSGRKKSPSSCALAKACVREMKVDGAIINLGFSYLIKGDTATRFKTSESVGREIVSFDRHQDFAAGKNYRLSKVGPSSRLDRPRTPLSLKSGPKLTKKNNHPEIHRTENVRVAKSI